MLTKQVITIRTIRGNRISGSAKTTIGVDYNRFHHKTTYFGGKRYSYSSRRPTN
jgi:hypothetical protein